MQYKALEDLKDAEVTKSLGVVNMTPVSTGPTQKFCRIPPTVYEMEVTPFNQCADMVEYCGDSSIVVMNLEPLAERNRMRTPRFADPRGRFGHLCHTAFA